MRPAISDPNFPPELMQARLIFSMRELVRSSKVVTIVGALILIGSTEFAFAQREIPEGIEPRERAQPAAPAAVDPEWKGPPTGTPTAPLTGNWNLAGNWSPSGVPASGNALSFGGSGSTVYVSTDDLTGFALSTVTLTSTATVAETIAGNTLTISGSSISQDNSGAFNIENNLTGTSAGATTLTLTGDGSGSVTLSGTISDLSGTNKVALTKEGSSTFILTGANTYTDATTISGGTLTAAGSGVSALNSTSRVTVNTGGTLLMGATNQFNATTPVTLAGGKLDAGGFSQGTTATVGVGALTLSASSIIDLSGTSSILHFADSHTVGWTGTLSIYNWGGTATTGGGLDQLLFGADSGALTQTQLNEISFYSGNGTGFLGTGAFATITAGEVVPVPEPTTWVAGTLVVAFLGWSQRRRFFQKLRG